MFRDSTRTRTWNLLLRRQLLYPVELWNQPCFYLQQLLCCCVGAAGFEPATPWSQTRCANRTALRPELIFSTSSHLPNLWREGDSNPRYGFPHACLANMWFQPLTHLSIIHLLSSKPSLFVKGSANIMEDFFSKTFCRIFFIFF